MSQSDFGNLVTTDPDGPTLGALLNAFRTALHSSHKGASRPTYAVAGTLWIEDDVTPWNVWIYDGADNVLVGTLNATTNVFAAQAPVGPTLTSLEALNLVSGDILYATAADTLARLPKGTNGQFLTLAAGLPAWAAEEVKAWAARWSMTNATLGDSFGLSGVTDVGTGLASFNFSTSFASANYAVAATGSDVAAGSVITEDFGVSTASLCRLVGRTTAEVIADRQVTAHWTGDL